MSVGPVCECQSRATTRRTQRRHRSRNLARARGRRQARSKAGGRPRWAAQRQGPALGRRGARQQRDIPGGFEPTHTPFSPRTLRGRRMGRHCSSEVPARDRMGALNSSSRSRCRPPLAWASSGGQSWTFPHATPPERPSRQPPGADRLSPERRHNKPLDSHDHDCDGRTSFPPEARVADGKGAWS